MVSVCLFVCAYVCVCVKRGRGMPIFVHSWMAFFVHRACRFALMCTGHRCVCKCYLCTLCLAIFAHVHRLLTLVTFTSYFFKSIMSQKLISNGQIVTNKSVLCQIEGFGMLEETTVTISGIHALGD